MAVSLPSHISDTMPPAKEDDGSPNLITIPPELRLQIYSHVCTKNAPSRSPRHPQPLPKFIIESGLMGTCKFIRSEAKNQYVAHLKGSLRTMLERIERLGLELNCAEFNLKTAELGGPIMIDRLDRWRLRCETERAVTRLEKAVQHKERVQRLIMEL